jgi:hypothetical protein
VSTRFCPHRTLRAGHRREPWGVAAMSLALAETGACGAVASNKSDSCEAGVRIIERAGGEAGAISCDVSKWGQPQRARQ